MECGAYRMEYHEYPRDAQRATSYTIRYMLCTLSNQLHSSNINKNYAKFMKFVLDKFP